MQSMQEHMLPFHPLPPQPLALMLSIFALESPLRLLCCYVVNPKIQLKQAVARLTRHHHLLLEPRGARQHHQSRTRECEWDSGGYEISQVCKCDSGKEEREHASDPNKR